MKTRHGWNRKKNGDRRATATVEMALCLPVMFLFFSAGIDLIRYNLLRNIVTQATYEGARAGIVKGATIQDVHDKVAEELAKFGTDLNYTLTTSPTVLPSNQETLTVTLSSNIRAAGWIISHRILGDTMVETMTIKLE